MVVRGQDRAHDIVVSAPNPYALNAGKLSAQCKCCLCCSLSIALLAVLIPLGFWLFGGNISQVVLNHSSFAVTNLTQAVCPHSYTWTYDDAKISGPAIGPFVVSTSIQPFEQ